MKESNVLRSCWLAVAVLGTTLFRLNTGKGWVGKGIRQPDGNVVVIGGRPVALGFGMPNGDPLVGTSDLGGWTSIIITPAMVGSRVAVSTFIETKESGGGDKRDGQINFINRVREAGGIAGFANSAEAALKIIRDFIRELSGGT